MQTFLCTNAFFEEELITKETLPPSAFLEKHPLYFQLQYLSFLCCDSSETPLLSLAPSKEYLDHIKNLGFSTSFALFSDPHASSSLISWGPSQSWAHWALKNGCSYEIPPIELVKKVQSKQFSFEECPSLFSSRLIHTQEELVSWWGSFSGPKVLKTPFGSSGRGHFIGSDIDLSKALLFFQKNSFLLIAQPWVERILDFSTQWNIKKDGSYVYLGVTLCENSSKGSYQKSLVGPEAVLFGRHIDFFEKHLIEAKKMIKKLTSLHFFGSIGFDSFLYKDPQTNKVELFPIVEINARKTMGWVALKIYEKFSSPHILSISYQSGSKERNGLLPSFKGSHLFAKQLYMEIKEIKSS